MLLLVNGKAAPIREAMLPLKWNIGPTEGMMLVMRKLDRLWKLPIVEQGAMLVNDINIEEEFE